MPFQSPAGVREASTLVRPLRVVALGGGTGLSTLLRGLRSHVTSCAQGATEKDVSVGMRVRVVVGGAHGPYGLVVDSIRP